MDSGLGRCWVCDAPGTLWCSGCRFALYCSLACLKKDRVRHLDECYNSSRRRVCCSYCGREEALGGVPCGDCLVTAYCTDSCRKIDAKKHRSVCIIAKQKVVEAAKKIQEWNRRAKGIPQYLGRLIHAVDYLRWSDNEGSRIYAPAKEKHKQNGSIKGATSKGGGDGGGGDVEGRRKQEERTKVEMAPQEEDALRILMLGADLKHVLRTLHDTPESCTQPLEIILVDSSPHILARDLLLLYLLMLPDARVPVQDPSLLHVHAEKVVMIFYSLILDMETHALLCNTLHNLLNMNHKSFLYELQQQIHISAQTYMLVQAVWNGWMSFANDPSAMHKMEKVRALKMTGKAVKDVLSRYVKSCPREHQKGVAEWIKRGSLKKHRGGNFPNVTLACFSPLKPEYLEKFEDVSPKWSEESEWIKAVKPEDEMIYAPHGIDMIFQDWDFVSVSHNSKKDSSVIDMYLRFLVKVFAKASYRLLRSNQVSIQLVHSNVRDLVSGSLPFKGKFDRIATGIHADLLGTPFILQELGSLLKTDNIYARMITHHRVWSLCLDWRSDQHAHEMCLKSLKNSRPPDPLLMLASRWATFRHFLQAELLHHLHMQDDRLVEPENVLEFRKVSHAYDMLLSDYTRQLNHIVPFRFRPEKRMISMVDSRLHTLEWHRIVRTRRSSAPPRANPPAKVLPVALSSDIDPASRYVDSLITLSRSSPAPPPLSPTPVTDSGPSGQIFSRESSLSPCPPDYTNPKEDRGARFRARSLYVSTRCKSPLLSPECDFWEQQQLMRGKQKTTKKRPCSEIPAGINRRAQEALEAEMKHAKEKAKSAPSSPQLQRKTKIVKEKASVFERGTLSRSTFPETRKSVERVTPTTPVKKLVSMFSKAFAAKEKEMEIMKPLKRSSSFDGHHHSFDSEDQADSHPKDYTNSLKINRSGKKTGTKKYETRNAIESGMCTLPRRSRPHSIAVSRFSYLDGVIGREKGSKLPATKTEEKKKEPKMSSAPNVKDNARSKRDHVSPIKNLIAGLNNLSVSPIMPRAVKQQKKQTHDIISVKRDDPSQPIIGPGSPTLSSPVRDHTDQNMFKNMKQHDDQHHDAVCDWDRKISPKSISKRSRNKTDSLEIYSQHLPPEEITENHQDRKNSKNRQSPSPAPLSGTVESSRVNTSAPKRNYSRSHSPARVSEKSKTKSTSSNKYSKCSSSSSIYTMSHTSIIDSPQVEKTTSQSYSPCPLSQSVATESPQVKTRSLRKHSPCPPSPLNLEGPLDTDEILKRGSHNVSSPVDISQIPQDNSDPPRSSPRPSSLPDTLRTPWDTKVTSRRRSPSPISPSRFLKNPLDSEGSQIRISRSVSPSLSRGSGAQKRLIKVIPSEPDYVAPPLYVSKSPIIVVESPSPESPKPPPVKDSSSQNEKSLDEEILRKLEYIFSPKSSPRTSLVESQLQFEEIRPVIEKEDSYSVVSVENETGEVDDEEAKSTEMAETSLLELINSEPKLVQEEHILSTEDLMSLTCGSMSSSMTEADLEVYELFSQDESFCPIKDQRSQQCEEENSETEEINPLAKICANNTETPQTILHHDRNESSQDGVGSQVIVTAQHERSSSPELICTSPKLSHLPSSSPLSEPTTPVSKIVERFVHRIQNEQLLVERPVSPKLENVMKRTHWKETHDESAVKEDSLVMKKPEELGDSELFHKGKVTSKEKSPEYKNPSSDSGRLKVSQLAKIISSISESANQGSSEGKAEDCNKGNEVLLNLISNDIPDLLHRKQSVSLRTTPVEELSSTPVTKMVEKFALEIKAQSLPSSPKSPRPLSIGTLIHQDILRLYTKTPTEGDVSDDEDDSKLPLTREDPPEEEVFQLSEDEGTMKDTSDGGNQTLLETKESIRNQTSNIGAKEESPKSEPDNSDTLRGQKSVKPKKDCKNLRDSRCNELRQEFLQKIRGMNESPIARENKKYEKKYDAIKATLSENRRDEQLREKAFGNELASIRQLGGSPQLDDMTVVSYTVEVKTEKIQTDPKTSICPLVSEPVNAITLLADRENQGEDGDTQELCTDQNTDEDVFFSSGNGNLSPRFYSLQREFKGHHQRESPTSSLNRKSLKKKIVEADMSPERANFIKSSKMGGLDKISFRKYVKNSILNEDNTPEDPPDGGMTDSNSKVVEHTSSFEVSSDELMHDPEPVEEAMDALSFLSPRNIPRRRKAQAKYPVHSDDPGNAGLGDGDEGNIQQQMVGIKLKKSTIRRKRLRSVHSPSEVHNEDNDDLNQLVTSEENVVARDSKEEILGVLQMAEEKGKSADTASHAAIHQVPQIRVKPPEEAEASEGPIESEESSRCDTPEIVTATSRDIRRFMWGSSKRKKKHPGSKTKRVSDIQQQAEFEECSSKAASDAHDKTSMQKFYLLERSKNTSTDDSFYSNEESLSTEIAELKHNVSSTALVKETTPTIVAMVPKQRVDSPIVEVTANRANLKLRNLISPPETPPKPKNLIPYRESSLSPEIPDMLNFKSWQTNSRQNMFKEETSISSIIETYEEYSGLAIGRSPSPRPPSASDEVFEDFRHSEGALEDEILLLDRSEQLTNDTSSSNDDNSRISLESEAEIEVEVRPRAGVLKKSRDRSRDSRRSLRVSWGDLPERDDSPQCYDERCSQEDNKEEIDYEGDTHRTNYASITTQL